MKRILALTLLLAGGCETPEEVPPEVVERRLAATRASCAAAELSRRAEDEYRTLEATLPSAGSPAGEMLRRATGAATEYARAYLQHAQLRAAAAAQVDSAMNFSREDEDSTRHARAAAQFSIRPPEPGTLEANVYTAYQQELANLLADSDHPCNWEPEEVEVEG